MIWVPLSSAVSGSLESQMEPNSGSAANAIFSAIGAVVATVTSSLPSRSAGAADRRRTPLWRRTRSPRRRRLLHLGHQDLVCRQVCLLANP